MFEAFVITTEDIRRAKRRQLSELGDRFLTMLAERVADKIIAEQTSKDCVIRRVFPVSPVPHDPKPNDK